LIPLFAGLTAGVISTQWTFLIVGTVLMVLMLVTLWIAKDRL
jgi:tetrahydromethanopterin S-methyltransferase subunit F